MSAKAQVPLQGKYRLSLVEPSMTGTAVKSYLQISFV